jgi:ribonucleotide monophosphatase NagD (HAD superfamily)
LFHYRRVLVVTNKAVLYPFKHSYFNVQKSNPIQIMSAEKKSFSINKSLTELKDKYDGFILDQFGVMHNGSTGLPGAPECVAELYKQGKKLVILSNSSSLAVNTIEKLPKLGYDPTMFAGAVTSGQEASRYVKSTYGSSGSTTKKALFITWKTPKVPSPMVFLEKCGNIVATDQPGEADFVLLHGCEVIRGPGADGEACETAVDKGFARQGETATVIDPCLKECLGRKLPMVCANPDFIMVKPDGSTMNMPGEIARRYEELGGTVTSFGKPHKEHFEACVKLLGLPKDKIAHIGDSLHHDIAGANDSGINSIFVAGGVHRVEIGCELGSIPSQESLEALFIKHGQTPSHVLPLLQML